MDRPPASEIDRHARSLYLNEHISGVEIRGSKLYDNICDSGARSPPELSDSSAFRRTGHSSAAY